MRRLSLTIVLLGAIAAQPACFLKFWGKGPPPQERQYDVYGAVESMSSEQLIVVTKQGRQTFQLGPASVKGSPSFEEGQIVHVMYKKLPEGNVVTLVVKKVK